MPPLTEHGERMKARMEKEYGKDGGERVLYASANAGKPGFRNIHRGGKRSKKRSHRRLRRSNR